MTDNIVLRPTVGAPPFDVASIRARLLSKDACFCDPLDTDLLFVVAGEGSRRFVMQERLESEQSRISAGIIEVKSESIVLAIALVGVADLKVMRDLAQWMLDTYQPTISSEVVGDDWTERCAGNIDIMFEPVLPRRASN